MTTKVESEIRSLEDRVHDLRRTKTVGRVDHGGLLELLGATERTFKAVFNAESENLGCAVASVDYPFDIAQRRLHGEKIKLASIVLAIHESFYAYLAPDQARGLVRSASILLRAPHATSETLAACQRGVDAIRSRREHATT